METKSQNAYFSSVFIYERECDGGNLLKIHTDTDRGNISSAVNVSVTGTATTDKNTSKLIRSVNKIVLNSFWRSILLKEFLGITIALLTELQGTVRTTPTPRTTSIKK